MLESISNEISACPRKHPYLLAAGLADTSVRIYTGEAEIGGVHCHDSPALRIRDIDGILVNVLFMVKSHGEKYEDVLIPGAKIAGCYGRIGELTETILIVEDYPSGLCLHQATGACVAVALYSDNLAAVATGLKSKYSKKTFVICASGHANPIGNLNYTASILAAQGIDALLACPPHPGTFYDHYRAHGMDGIHHCLEIARAASEIQLPLPPRREASLFAQTAQWPNPVSGTALMTDLITVIPRCVILEPEAVEAVALWILLTHCIDAVRVAPILAICSPTRRCGKTSLLHLLKRLVLNPDTTSNLTTAALYRLLDIHKLTLLIDEADTFLAGSKDLIGVLNSGHTRDNASVKRVGRGNILQAFDTFGPKAIAGIKHLPETLMDRSIAIVLRRKRIDEVVTRDYEVIEGNLEALRARIARWSHDNLAAIKSARPSTVTLSSDRSLDNWEPLLAIAHCLGSEWHVRATNAAKQLTSLHEDIKCSGEEMLRDVQLAFISLGVERISTSSLLQELCADTEKPWATYNRGRPLTPRDISTLLAPFGIRSKNLRTGTAVAKGYELEQFEDAFSRYLPNGFD